MVRANDSVVVKWTGGQAPHQLQQSGDPANSNAREDLDGPLPTNSLKMQIGSSNLFLRVRGQ